MNLDDKTAVITGAASGIARATAQHFVTEGMKAVALVDLNPEVKSVCARINGEAGREACVAFQGDVTDREFRKTVFKDLDARFGCVNVCVPAAGIVKDDLAVKIDRETGEPIIYDQDLFERIIDVNLVASIYWAIETVASVAAHRSRAKLGPWTPEEGVSGAVVFIGSISSAGNKGQICYATSKAGLDGAQSTLAKESIRFGVRTGIIHPGFTDTPMVRSLGAEFLADKILPNTQLKRLLDPHEIADAIAFMMRNNAVSGAIWADAGWHPAA